MMPNRLLIVLFSMSSGLFALKTNVKISLNCDVRPFNDLHLFNYFLKQQIKQHPIPIPNENLTKKFYDFRSNVDLSALEAECDKKSVAQFALIQKKGKNNKYALVESATNGRLQKNRKEISQRMSLELVNALLLGKILGLNLGMISSVIFRNAFKAGGQGGPSTPAPGGAGGGGAGGGGSDRNGGEGDSGGGGNEGGDSGRYEDDFSRRYDEEQDEYCDDQEGINESSVESLHDYGDQYSNHRIGYDRKRHKRDLYVNKNSRHSPSVRQFLSSVEDNEDLWSSSGASLYIPAFNRLTPDMTSNTAIDNHLSTTDRKKSNVFPSYTLSNEPSVPILAPSSFAFSQVPIIYRIPTKKRTTIPSISSLFRSKNKSTLDLKTYEQSYSNRREPASPNLYSISYDQVNVDNLADSADYTDASSNRKDRIDLEHKESTTKQPEYFNEELFDEEKIDDRELKTEEFTRNFNENFDKKFKPKRPVPKRPKKSGSSRNERQQNRSSSKKKIDLSQLEREDEEVEDRREGKLVRITRKITMKNLFESDDLLESNDLLSDNVLLPANGELNSSKEADSDERKEEDKKNLPRLKRKRRIRKRMKGKRKKSSATKSRKKKTKKQILKSTSKRKKKGGKRRGTKSRSLNLISQNDSNSSIHLMDNFNLLSSPIYDDDLWGFERSRPF